MNWNLTENVIYKKYTKKNLQCIYILENSNKFYKSIHKMTITVSIPYIKNHMIITTFLLLIPFNLDT